MSADLLAKAVAAHGGLDRWNQYASVRAAVSVGGALWAAKGRPGVLADVTVEARLHEQRVTTHLNGRGLRYSFVPGRVAVENEGGRVVSEPRSKPSLARRANGGQC